MEKRRKRPAARKSTYYDQFVLGRFDGENHNIGLFDICLQLHPEMKAALEASSWVYGLHAGEMTANPDKLERLPMIPTKRTEDARSYARYDAVKSKYPCGCVVFELSSTQVYLDNLSNVYNTYMPRIVFGMVDDPAAFVVEFREQLQAAGASSSAALLAFQRETCRPICESLRV